MVVVVVEAVFGVSGGFSGGLVVPCLCVLFLFLVKHVK